MKRKLAHVMRRVARVLIGWSTTLEPPAVYVAPKLKPGYMDGYRYR